MKYLTLISAIALLHQHQRQRKTATIDGTAVTYIEATASDIELANRLAADVLGRSLDELPPQTRRLLDLLHEMVTVIAEEAAVTAADVRFTRRQARERLGWGDTQLKVHLGRLVDMEFLVVHRPQGPGPFAFELAWAPPAPGAGDRFLPGLVHLHPDGGEGHGYDDQRSGPEESRSGAGRGLVGAVSGSGRGTPGRPLGLVKGRDTAPAGDPDPEPTVPAGERIAGVVVEHAGAR